MLHGVAAFMSCHGNGRHAGFVVHALAQVHGAVQRVIVVRQAAGGGNHLHMIQPILVQHAAGGFGTGKRGRFLGIAVKSVFQAGLDGIADDGGDNNQRQTDERESAVHAAGLAVVAIVAVVIVGTLCKNRDVGNHFIEGKDNGEQLFVQK